MTALAQSLRQIKKPWQWIVIGLGILLIWAFFLPSFLRGRYSAPSTQSGEAANFSIEPRAASKQAVAIEADQATVSIGGKLVTDAALRERKIIRTSSLDLVVQHPADVAEKITALAEKMDGYVESANGGGENATSGNLTIRVPAARFEEARAAIRKLGLRVQAERVDAQDVTRQYVDKDARIRNLRAGETQLLAILKQAVTVKDMMAVSERLSEVRGEIEREQAEFNALSRQVETVSFAISLRTESEAKVFALDWRPLDQLKLALHDGLESVANYASAMLAILFYLPAVILWSGTILLGLIGSWRVFRWIGQRWFGWKPVTLPQQS
jgi:hypothetical protein